MPAVCRFYIKGYCRYGRNCRFEHPGEEDNSTQTCGAGGFSFTRALQEVSPASPSQGFSFTRALETAQTSSPFGQHYNQSQPFTAQNNYQNNYNSNLNNSYFNNNGSYSFQQQQYYRQNSNASGGFSFTEAFQSTINPNANPLSVFNSSLTQNFVPTNFTPIDIDIRTFDQEVLEDEPQLTELEIKAYQDEKFNFRQIPIRPPPRHLCY